MGPSMGNPGGGGGIGGGGPSWAKEVVLANEIKIEAKVIMVFFVFFGSKCMKKSKL